jgi:hypothetical protein
MAEAALDAAVIYERERGATWAEIASYLGMSSADVEERFSDHLATWHRALAAATRAPATPGLPWVLKTRPMRVTTWTHGLAAVSC